VQHFSLRPVLLSADVRGEFERELRRLQEASETLDYEDKDSDVDDSDDEVKEVELTAQEAAQRVRAAELREFGLLDMQDEDLGDRNVESLAKEIAKSQLTSIQLQDNAIGDEGAAALGAAVYKSSKVVTLDLGYNDVTAVGAAALAAVVELSHTLSTLNLAKNPIGNDGAQVLATALSRNTDRQADAIAEELVYEVILAQMKTLVTRELRFESCRMATYKPRAEPPKIDHIEEVIRVHLDYVDLDDKLLALFSKQLLQDTAYARGSVSREQVAEDMTQTLVERQVGKAEPEIAASVQSLLQECFAAAEPGEKERVQIRPSEESRPAVERWRASGSGGTWTPVSVGTRALARNAADVPYVCARAGTGAPCRDYRRSFGGG
jgi:hypothetical protein